MRRYTSKNGTIAHSTAQMPISSGEFLDVERYLDVKRGELYLGKAVILVEGIAEEYIIPRLAEKLNMPLDEKGIIICNVNCTAFKPYIKLLHYLQIPYTVITDGDFYRVKKKNDSEIMSDEDEEMREYHVLMNDITDEYTYGYLGLENMSRIMSELGNNAYAGISDETQLRTMFNKQGVFIGRYTFEVEMMEKSRNNSNAKQVFVSVYKQLTGDRRYKISNFTNKLETGDYEFCLRRIEDQEIGKGRFAQRFSGECLAEHCPSYIEDAIKYIYEKVDD